MAESREKSESHEQMRMRKCLPMLPELQKTARLCGYALLIHGSLKRDIDLVAVPWTEEAVTAEQLAESIRQRAEELNNAKAAFLAPHEAHEFPKHKPHGRLCWGFHLGGGPYLDLSVMPTQSVQREAGRRDALEEQWISVEEKLPKCEGYYLVVHVRRGIDMLWSNPASPSDLWYWKSEVTHWRELPEPPKVAIRALEEKPQ